MLQKIDRGARKVTPAPTNNSTRSACLLLRGARPPSPRLLLLPRLARRVVIVDRCATLERLLGGRQRRACARAVALAVHCAGCVPRRGGHHPSKWSTARSWCCSGAARGGGERREGLAAREGGGPSGALSCFHDTWCATTAPMWEHLGVGHNGAGARKERGRGRAHAKARSGDAMHTRRVHGPCVSVARHTEV